MAEWASRGDWSLPAEAVFDAFSVIGNSTATDVKLPLEESLVATVVASMAWCSIGMVRVLWWCRTSDMLADAITKGAVQREPLP